MVVAQANAAPFLSMLRKVHSKPEIGILKESLENASDVGSRKAAFRTTKYGFRYEEWGPGVPTLFFHGFIGEMTDHIHKYHGYFAAGCSTKGEEGRPSGEIGIGSGWSIVWGTHAFVQNQHAGERAGYMWRQDDPENPEPIPLEDLTIDHDGLVIDVHCPSELVQRMEREFHGFVANLLWEDLESGMEVSFNGEIAKPVAYKGRLKKPRFSQDLYVEGGEIRYSKEPLPRHMWGIAYYHGKTFLYRETFDLPTDRACHLSGWVRVNPWIFSSEGKRVYEKDSEKGGLLENPTVLKLRNSLRAQALAHIRKCDRQRVSPTQKTRRYGRMIQRGLNRIERGFRFPGPGTPAGPISTHVNPNPYRCFIKGCEFEAETHAEFEAHLKTIHNFGESKGGPKRPRRYRGFEVEFIEDPIDEEHPYSYYKGGVLQVARNTPAYQRVKNWARAEEEWILIQAWARLTEAKELEDALGKPITIDTWFWACWT